MLSADNFLNFKNYQDYEKIYQSIKIKKIFLWKKIITNKNFFIKIIFHILLLQILSIEQVKAISVNQLINIAIENNQELTIAKSKLNNVRLLQDKAIAEFMPNIWIGLNKGIQNTKSNNTENFSQEGNFYNKEIQFEQSIFKGFFGINNLKKSEKIYLIDLSNYLERQQQIIFEILKLCLTNNLLKKQQNFLQEIFENIQNLNKILNAKLKLNQTTKQKLIDNQNEQLALSLQINQKKTEIDDNFAQLILICNLANLSNQEIDFAGYDIFEKLPNIKTLVNLIDFNYSLRAKYLNNKLQIDEINIKKSEFSPTISLIGNLSQQKNNIYLQNQKIFNQSISINLKIPLFQKGLEYTNYKDAIEKQQITLKEYNYHKNILISELNKQHNQYNSLEKNLELCNVILKNWQEKISISKSKIDLNIADLSELYETKISYLNQNIICQKIECDRLISMFKIKSLIGDLFIENSNKFLAGDLHV
jgi:outer membrane protein TolC